MEQKIKNFDRSIEQIMNEAEVAPPFGMWNRISAELGAEAIPAAAVKQAIPKRALIGVFALALMVTTAGLTAYFVNHYNSQQQKPLSQSSAKVEVNVPPVAVISEPVAVASESPAIIKSKRPVGRKVTNQVAVVAESIPASQHLTLKNTETFAPEQAIAENTTGVSEPYYFPAIDVNAAEGKPVAKEVNALPVKTAIAESKPLESKAKVSVSEEKKIKFRPKKKVKWTFGRINRKKSKV